MDAEHIFVDKLTAGQKLDQVFVVREKELRTTRAGSSRYIQCTLADRTGSLPARMWQATEAMYSSVPEGGFLQVKGRCEDYKGALQIIIEACRPIPPEKVDIADYLPVTEHDVEKMWSELLDIVRDVKNKHLRMLIKKFVEDRQFVEGFKKAPAAMSMHNPFIGGLLEHTLQMARSAKALLPLYPKLNRDLVLASVFFHDMGKIAELTADLTMSYTDKGQLVGHITIAAVWLAEKAAAVAEDTGEPFPEETLNLLQHIVLSHHGAHEFGSPKLPAVPEAFLIHYLDNLDAKMYMTTHAIESDADPKANFTAYNRQLETYIYKHSDSLE